MTIKIYQVGGSVRDLKLGKSPKDIDYAVEAPSYEDMKKYILSTGGEIFLETPEYVTIRALWAAGECEKRHPCDFTLCRKESGYDDFRHPTKIEPGTILEDLSRRDFSINAMAIDTSTAAIIDPYSGLEDIKLGILRAVRNPYERFGEDALRILRLIRFSIVLDFEIEQITFLAAKSCLHLLTKISTDRIREELLKMFKHDTIRTINLLSKITDNDLRYFFNERTKLWLEPTNKK